MNQLEYLISKDTNSMLSRSRNIISIMSKCKVHLKYHSRKSLKNNNRNKKKNAYEEHSFSNIPSNAIDIGILVKEHRLEAELIASNQNYNGYLSSYGFASVWYISIILVGVCCIFGIRLLQKRVYSMSKKRD